MSSEIINYGGGSPDELLTLDEFDRFFKLHYNFSKRRMQLYRKQGKIPKPDKVEHRCYFYKKSTLYEVILSVQTKYYIGNKIKYSDFDKSEFNIVY